LIVTTTARFATRNRSFGQPFQGDCHNEGCLLDCIGIGTAGSTASDWTPGRLARRRCRSMSRRRATVATKVLSAAIVGSNRSACRHSSMKTSWTASSASAWLPVNCLAIDQTSPRYFAMHPSTARGSPAAMRFRRAGSVFILLRFRDETCGPTSPPLLRRRYCQCTGRLDREQWPLKPNRSCPGCRAGELQSHSRRVQARVFGWRFPVYRTSLSRKTGQSPDFAVLLGCRGGIFPRILRSVILA
jgi:hypothetical protein